MKNFQPKKNYVLVHFEKKEDSEKKTKSGIILPNQGSDEGKTATPGKYDFIVTAIGPDVEHVKVGERVIFNEYDMKGLQDEDDEKFAIMKEDSVMATYE